MQICSIVGCDKRSEKRGWCGMHYRRWLVHGDTGTTLKAANGAGYTQGGYLGHQIDGVRVFDHVRAAEKALGKPLPAGAVVHHVNEIKSDNRPSNLVICPDKAYHNLIHARMRAMEATGDPFKRKCRICKIYDSVSNLSVAQKQTGAGFLHPQCLRNYANAKYEKKPARPGAVTFNGVTDTYKGWAARSGIKGSTIAMRINSYGWSVEKALTKGALL